MPEPLWISWSQLKTFEACRQKAKLYKQHKQAPLMDHRVFFAGSVVDRAVRNWLDNDPLDHPKDLELMVVDIIDTEKALIEAEGGVMKWKDDKDREQVTKDVILAAKRLQIILPKLIIPYEYQPALRFKAPLFLPHPLTKEPTQIILNGEIDILKRRQDNGNWEVWDLKITKNKDYWRGTVGQLTFYDMCVNIMFGEYTSVTGLIQPLVEGVPIFPYKIDDDIRSQMMTRVAKFANAMWLDDMPPTAETAYECSICNVKHACSKFVPVKNAAGFKTLTFGK